MVILFAILIFSFLIFIHELGHFIAAKASGVQVNEFSMFMGPAIFKKQKGETLYSLRCIPLGGYCAMEGEDGDSDNPRSFQRASWWKRLIILVSGAGMNFIAGLLIFLIVFLPTKAMIVPVVEDFEPGCTLNAPGGLMAGDEIIEVDGEKIYSSKNFSTILYLNGGDVHDLVVLRNGEKVELNDFAMPKQEFPNDDGTTSLRYGFSFSVVEPTFWDKVGCAWNETLDSVRNVRLSLQMLLSGKASFKDVTGPVGIVDQMSTMADASETKTDALLNMLWFGGFIAVNLAVMNLLPIPALDGGRVVTLLLTTAIEKITKKKVNPKYEGYINGIGMLLLLGLMAIIMFKDIIFIFKR